MEDEEKELSTTEIIEPYDENELEGEIDEQNIL